MTLRDIQSTWSYLGETPRQAFYEGLNRNVAMVWPEVLGVKQKVLPLETFRSEAAWNARHRSLQISERRTLPGDEGFWSRLCRQSVASTATGTGRRGTTILGRRKTGRATPAFTVSKPAATYHRL